MNRKNFEKLINWPVSQLPKSIQAKMNLVFEIPTNIENICVFAVFPLIYNESRLSVNFWMIKVLTKCHWNFLNYFPLIHCVTNREQPFIICILGMGKFLKNNKRG